MVLEAEDLVFGAVVPAGVEVCEAGQRLLVHTTAIGVDFGNAGIVYGGKV